MTQQIYIKDESFDPIYKEVSKEFYARARVVPASLVVLGLLILLSQVALPLVVFKTQDISSGFLDNVTIIGRFAGFFTFQFKELGKNFSNSKNLTVENINSDIERYAQSPEYIPRKITDVMGVSNTNENTPEYFYLRIPKLGIDKAMVEINAKTLNPIYALGHYKGTKLPGENGNAFVYGHSVLPWFFNQKNYKTIFSTLDRLEKGDEFYVTINNKEYTYKVDSVVEMKPDQVDPLADIKPKYLNESTMVLMTCSPPGTKMKRLLVNAVLEY